VADVILTEVADRVATVTLNRPEARNALNGELLAALPETLRGLDLDDGVDAIVLTGADPAFCAGLDLKELGSEGGLSAGFSAPDDSRGGTAAVSDRGPFPPMTTPVIGAVNGVAVTGGFELALNCSFLVASDRARFADTHARVGVMPGWGLTVLLPEAVGRRRARQLSATGNFLAADVALAWGLVNAVVPHADLLPTCRALAADIAGNDRAGVARVLETYDAVAEAAPGARWDVEARMAREWQGATFDPAEGGRRREGIVARGRAQTSSQPPG